MEYRFGPGHITERHGVLRTGESTSGISKRVNRDHHWTGSLRKAAQPCGASRRDRDTVATTSDNIRTLSEQQLQAELKLAVVLSRSPITRALTLPMERRGGRSAIG